MSYAPSGPETRPLPPGWISEFDGARGLPYFVNTSLPNPQAVWEDPRPAYYAALTSSGSGSPYPALQPNQYAPPSTTPYPQQSQSPYPQSQSPYPQQPVQQQQGQGQAAGYYAQPDPQQPSEKGLLSGLGGLMGGKTNQQQQGQYGYPQPQQQPSGSSSPFNKNTLLAGGAGVGIAALGYELFKHHEEKEHRHEGRPHEGAGLGGFMGGGGGGPMGEFMGGGGGPMGGFGGEGPGFGGGEHHHRHHEHHGGGGPGFGGPGGW
ncbi:hypothetical protein JCM1841_006267 [Sporobolomyces salmonicolor]